MPTPPMTSEERIDVDGHGDSTPPQVIPYKTAIKEPMRRIMPVQSNFFSDFSTLFALDC